MNQIGGWLFRQRTWLPLPLVAMLLLVPPDTMSSAIIPAGIALVACGEGLRLWAVRQIGAVSRTRSDRLGPLVDSGPFARVRNPLYLGNFALWVGFTLSAAVVWLVPVIAVILAFEYHAIVRWEEQLLLGRLGEPYRAYLDRVPRWVPSFSGAPRAQREPAFSWSETLYSERGTLIAIAAGFLLLWAKANA